MHVVWETLWRFLVALPSPDHLTSIRQEAEIVLCAHLFLSWSSVMYRLILRFVSFTFHIGRPWVWMVNCRYAFLQMCRLLRHVSSTEPLEITCIHAEETFQVTGQQVWQRQVILPILCTVWLWNRLWESKAKVWVSGGEICWEEGGRWNSVAKVLGRGSHSTGSSGFLPGWKLAHLTEMLGSIYFNEVVYNAGHFNTRSGKDISI